jgi:hypothetical protein
LKLESYGWQAVFHRFFIMEHFVFTKCSIAKNNNLQSADLVDVLRIPKCCDIWSTNSKAREQPAHAGKRAVE